MYYIFDACYCILFNNIVMLLTHIYGNNTLTCYFGSEVASQTRADFDPVNVTGFADTFGLVKEGSNIKHRF